MKKFFMDENGQGMVEYGLIIALVALAAVALLGGLGGKIASMFGAADAALTVPGAGGGEG